LTHRILIVDGTAYSRVIVSLGRPACFEDPRRSPVAPTTADLIVLGRCEFGSSCLPEIEVVDVDLFLSARDDEIDRV
jgi:hypothetical protein